MSTPLTSPASTAQRSPAASSPHARSPLAENLTSLVLEVFRLHGRFIATGDRLTKDMGLSAALWQVLSAVNPTPLPMAQIGRNRGLTRQSVRRSVTVLMNKGHVTLENNPDHRRAKLVVLTPQGRTALEQVTIRQIHWSNSLTPQLNDLPLDDLITTMQALQERIP